MRLSWILASALAAVTAQADVYLTNLYSFSGNGGANPQAGLVQGSDGNFYGTTYGGGTNGGGGTVFKISVNGTPTSLYSFTGSNDGAGPVAGLVQAGDGYLYGTTSGGGTNGGGGTVFKITTNGALTSLYSFTGDNDGGSPGRGQLQVGADGNYYGTTFSGGTNNYGTVFKISTNGALASLYSFTGGGDGASPVEGLVQGIDGNFYGTTYAGGTNGGNGTVFKIGTNGALTSLYSFTGGNDGANPEAGLVQGIDGNFYGTTTYGGSNGGNGTMFRISTNGMLTNLFSFNGQDGAYPAASLLQASDGFLYGTTLGPVALTEGNPLTGSVFKISTSGALTSLYVFPYHSTPTSWLVQGSDGSFYGTTFGAGQNGDGIVFRMTTVPVIQTVTHSAGQCHLTWTTEAGGMYQLQYCTSLSSSNWTNLGGATNATGATLSGTDYLTNGPQRFYRVVVAP